MAGLASVYSRGRFLLWLALPFAFYLIPVFMGFSWNGLSEGHNILNPPEAYVDRLPDRRTTVESWGASVVNVPFHARLHAYLRDLQLPLWNPYQGLGQPFAAQGEENPYSPFAIARAVLHYSQENYVTLAVFYLSTVCLYLFLRGLGVEERAAIFGGATFAVSGALSLQIGRPNLADQVSLIPVLFWAAARAVRDRGTYSYAVFAVVAALHLLGGFIQIAMLSAVLVVLFCVAYAHYLAGSHREWIRRSLMMMGVFAFGNALVAFYLLPLLEAMITTFNKDIPQLALFVPIGLGNAIGFFLPLLFGFSLNQSWSPGPAVTDWDNLYAFAGTTVLVCCIYGLAVRRWPSPLARLSYWFFFGAGIFLTLRYVGAAPARLADYLPIIGQQSPKHATGVMAFCFVVAASIAVGAIKAWDFRRGTWWVLIVAFYGLSLVAQLIERAGYTSTREITIDWNVASPSLLATAYVTTLAAASFWLVSRWRGASADTLVTVLTAATVAELVTYIPLGNGAFSFLAARLLLATVLVASGFLLALGKRWPAGGLFGIVLVGYALLVLLPSVGLPRAIDLDGPPRFLFWLKQQEGTDWRSFGIAPDNSSDAQVQDISVVGPMAPREFADFIQLISDGKTTSDYFSTTHFMLAGPWNYGLDQYQTFKPILDWVGVRYLVLDRVYFNVKNRTDDEALLNADLGMRVAYEDDKVRILESPSALPKAEFWSAAQVYPSQAAILAALKAQPRAILGPPMLEAASAGVPAQSPSASTGALPAAIELYGPNSVRVRVDAPSSGVLVLKDSYFPGWIVALNGSPARVVRVDGFVRGVVIPGPGQYEARFEYQPDAFWHGLWLSVLGWGLLVACVAHAVRSGQHRVPWWGLIVGSLLVAWFLAMSSQAYFVRPGVPG